MQRFLYIKLIIYYSLDAIELATNTRKNNSQTLQCIKCKQHLVGRTRESTKAMLLYHYENDECVERSIRYTVPHDRQMKYKHHYTAYCKDFMIYADFEAINKNLTGQAFAEVDEFNFSENKNVTKHEIVSAQYIVIVNDSKLNFREHLSKALEKHVMN